MSLFKDKEDRFARAFDNLYSDDSEDDDNDDDCDEKPKEPKPGTEESTETSNTQISNHAMISSTEEVLLDSDTDSSGSTIIADQVITISDDESEQEQNLLNATSDSVIQIPDSPLNVSSTVDDYDFNLKMMVSGTYKQFSTTYRTRLDTALKGMLDELRSLGRTLIVTSRDDIPISLSESPHSLGLTSGSILRAIEVSLDTNKQSSTTDPNAISIKLQDGNRKHLKEFQLGKTEPINKLKHDYAKEFNLDVNSIRLCFDGDIVDDESSAEDLDIEDGCVIDVLVNRNA